ncbi:flagellar hook-length control protein FliK [Sphaerotilus microaerophilus]|uniref:flagellar hook-length control protein FliK n=1 Tax=Sphaerotilus microaerophilus TaxID=2914710 RepID=UPI0020748095|nr:flagellar hook-length control protein FliK [Sphaerotilus sp. FB-5]
MSTSTSLVQETARAERGAIAAAAANRRNGAPSGGAEGGAEDFAGLLQSCTQPDASASAGPGAGANGPNGARGLPVVQPGQAAEAARAGSRAAQTPTPITALGAGQPVQGRASAEGASDPALARDAAKAPRPQAARPAGAAQTAEAGGSADEPAAAERRQADRATEDAPGSLAQWLMQIGVIPAQGALDGAAATGADLGEGAGGLAESQGDARDRALGRSTARSGGVFRIPSTSTQALQVEAAVLERTAGTADRQPFTLDAAQAGERPGWHGADPALSAGLLAEGDQASAVARDQGDQGAQGAGTAGFAAGAIDLSGALGAAGLWAPGADVAAAPATAVEVTVQTHFDDPGMAEEVLLHVGQLARDGIGEASLHLNPAEMGPIRVQITLDGRQARIDFAATHAATRELLEASLPALAQSLSSDGLTLAGSSVSAPPDPAAVADGTGFAPGGDSSSASRQSDGRQAEDRAPARPGSAPSATPMAASAGEVGLPGRAAPRADMPRVGLRALDLYA